MDPFLTVLLAIFETFDRANQTLFIFCEVEYKVTYFKNCKENGLKWSKFSREGSIFCNTMQFPSNKVMEQNAEQNLDKILKNFQHVLCEIRDCTSGFLVQNLPEKYLSQICLFQAEMEKLPG